MSKHVTERLLKISLILEK